MPMPTHSATAATSSQAAASDRVRSNCAGSAASPPGSQRATTSMAPSAAIQPVSARLMGRNTVFHSGRARTTMISAPV